MRHHSLPLLLSLLPLALITAAVTPATAQTLAAPSSLSFQGRLTTPSGNPVPDGNYSIRFQLYNAAAAGTILWEQTVAATAVKNGTFAALLNVGSGFQNGATAATLFNGNVWLSVKVGADAELTPRSRIASVAYALKANTVPDGSLTAAKFAGGVLAPGGAAGGDLTGFYPNPQLNTDASLLYKVSGTLMSASGAGVSVNAQQTQSSNEVNDSAWQSFTPTVSGQITGLDIYVGTTTGLSKTIPVVLFSGEGTSGAELARKTTTFSTSLTFQHVDFNTPITVVGGQKYTWFIGTSSSLKFGYATANPYAGGRADIGASLDYAFRSYQTAGTTGLISVAANLNIGGDFALPIGKRMGLNPADAFVYDGDSIGNNTLGWYNDSENPGGATGGLSGFAGLKLFSGGAPRVTLTQSGNLGIGTTTPGFPLTFANGNGDKISLYGQSGANYGLGIAPGTLQIHSDSSASDIAFGQGSSAAFTEVMRVKGNGRVGIGTTSPSSPLHVADGGGITVGTSSTSGGYTALSLSLSAVSGGNAQIQAIKSAGSDYGDLILNPSGGNVGIGTITPTNPLTVAGNANVTGAFNVAGQTNVGGALIVGPLIEGYGSTKMTIHSVGTELFALVVYGPVGGNGIYSFGRGANSTGVFGISIDGRGYGVRSSGRAGGTSGWENLSDARYKTNVHTFDNALEAILNLRGVTFDFIQHKNDELLNFPQGQQIGFIAQEVEKVLPQLVSKDGKGFRSVAYANVVPVLVEAMKTLKKEADAQKAENATLRAELDALKAAVRQLQNDRK